MVLLEKSKKVKMVLKNRHGPTEKKWNMTSKSVTVVPEKSGKVKNVLKNRYGPSKGKR